jgi:diguanylate cyclase (GGDEF)-like protein
MRLNGDSLALILMDLNEFKEVNDTLGHFAGDQLLRQVGERLSRFSHEPGTLVARLGGDEFALWMNGADHMTAAERAEHLCVEVPRELREIAGDGGPPTTISIGIVTRVSGSQEPVDSLLRRADRAMYEVKRTGRGHWHVATEETA